MTELLHRYDHWLQDGGPSALVLHEYLEPAGGDGDVIFPPTFAPPEDAKDKTPGYVIDGEGDQSVCLIDSVGSQANRLEPVFKQERYRKLVPQVTITVDGRAINLLDAGHRAADALVRSTSLAAELEQAFRDYDKGNASPLAKAAPTTLVFGAWDSRATQVKAPRLLHSTIRATNVRKLNRAAQYFCALEQEEIQNFLETDLQKQRKLLSKAGFLDSPSGLTHGGILVHGDILRTAILNLTALRALGASNGEDQLEVRRYILGLSLLALCAPIDFFLRQGCLLCQRQDRPPALQLVHRNGQREGLALALEEAESFARAAAEAFGPGPDRTVAFDPKIAKEVLKKAAKEKKEDAG